MPLREIEVTELQVRCPHCSLGTAPVHVLHKGGGDEIEGIQEPRKCSICNNYFTLKLRMHVVGVPLPVTGPTPSQGTLIHNLLEA